MKFSKSQRLIAGILALTCSFFFFAPFASAKKSSSHAKTQSTVSTRGATYFKNPSTVKSGTGTIRAQGLFGATLKGMRVLAAILRGGGWLLKKVLKPLSPSKAKLVHHHARKAAWALESADKATRSAVSRLLQKTGMSETTADQLTYVLFLIL